MFQVENYLKELTTLLQKILKERLLYVGLQGSYLRAEATESSDLDIMVVIDSLTVSDLDTYRQAIAALPNPEKSCGFICGKTDLLHWNPIEICHLLHTTKDYYGTLSTLVPSYTSSDVLNYIKMSVNNLYHEICHRYIHGSTEKNVTNIASTYKSVFFILQNIYYLDTGTFVPTKKDLLLLLSGKDRLVLDKAIHMSMGETYDFAETFSLLFSWCQETMARL